MTVLIDNAVLATTKTVGQTLKAAGWTTTAIKTGAYSAVAGEFVLTDTTGGAFIVTLPGSATSGQRIGFFDVSNNWGVNAVTLNRNGLNIEGAAANFDLDGGRRAEIVYVDASTGWAFDVPTYGTLSTQDANAVAITGGSITGITDLALADGGTAASTAVAALDNLSPKGADIASASTTNIANATGHFVHVTGTTTITAFGTATAGVKRTVRFAGALTLTHNATSLILPTGANITTAANDVAVMVSEGSGNWRCVAYSRADGTPLTASTLDSDLTALANNSTNGLWARTGSGTGSARTLTAGSARVTVTNGDGVSGNPTVDVAAASDTAAGIIEIATTAETNTGTDAARSVSPDGLAGSYAGTEPVSLAPVATSATAWSTGDGKAWFVVPANMNGMNLVSVLGVVHTAGTTGTQDVQFRRRRSGSDVDMLSTKLTWDSTEASTATAATAAVINGSNDDVATGDIIYLDVDAVQTTPAQGGAVALEFRLP